MNSGTHWGRNPSSDGLQWHSTSENDICVIRVTAGQRPDNPANDKRPQQDSNLRSRLRRPLLYPLSYGGCATQKGTSRKRRANTSSPGGTIARRETLPSPG